MHKALIIGSINVDLTAKVKALPKLGETIMSSSYYESFGGKGANQAIAAAKQGIQVELIACVGNDEYGQKLIENVEKNKVKASIFKSTSNSSGRAIITVDDKGDNTIVVIPGANYDLNVDNIDESIESIKNTDVLIMQNEILSQTILHSLKIANKFNKLTIFNPAPAQKFDKEIYEYIDFLILNETELNEMFDISIFDENYLEKLLEEKKKNEIKNIILTLGSMGSVAIIGDTISKFDAYKVKAIDSTAAGDSFIGAFSKKYLETKNIEKSIKYASLVASIVVTRKGAQESIPSIEEVEQYILEMGLPK